MSLSYLNIDKEDLIALGAIYTAEEIESQPQLWKETFKSIVNSKEEIIEFLSQIYDQDNVQVILTGAGTSAFIGETLQGPFQKHTGLNTRAVSTTDLVTHPQLYLNSKYPILLISFARSGDSPESVAAVDLANKICKNIYHLIITCNYEGKLAKIKNSINSLIFILPPGANDKGLAMTASFTSMLLSGYLISVIQKIDSFENQIQKLAEYGNRMLRNYLGDLKKIAELEFDRAVFLGSGPFLGIARESHLKLQELTDGKVICKFDSFLGFRHGPKAVMNKKTLIVFLFSNDTHVHKYEIDLVKAVNESEKGICSIGVIENEMNDFETDLKLVLSENSEVIDETLMAICSVLSAQLIGFFKSINLGLKPDNPSSSGTITRVVQGVHIYQYY